MVEAPRASPSLSDSWLNDSIAYAPQQAYVQHGTIRDNILFGLPFNRERYQEVLRQASLLSDLGLMPDGDATEVGAKGVTLSGGQKARINIARCLYSRARTVYMDDVLSALDAHTSQFIVQQCFAGKLFQDRTLVLVSHQVDLCMPLVDLVVSVDGEVSCCPSTAENTEVAALEPVGSPSTENETTRQVYKDENLASGTVQAKHYWFVITAAGGFGYWFLLALLYFGARGTDVLRSLWLEHWSADPDPNDIDLNLGVYAVLVSGGVFTGILQWVWLYGIGNVGFFNRGARIIHERFIQTICAAPLSFFEATPTSRILNVVGRDMMLMDTWSADAFGGKCWPDLADVRYCRPGPECDDIDPRRVLSGTSSVSSDTGSVPNFVLYAPIVSVQ